MAILGNIISRSLTLRKNLAKKVAKPIVYQQRTLRKLMERAKFTQFGKHYSFDMQLESLEPLSDVFRKTVPLTDYSGIFNAWWHKLLEGEENVTWPGKVKYFALSSGTSESASKHIPVTQDMIRSIKKVGFKQFYSITNWEVNPASFTKGMLMLGGSTTLYDKGDYYEGDMSGISAKNLPRLVSNLMYKPGQKISRTPDWEDRIELIIENAPKWDVATLCGVPAWAQIVLERIIKRHKLTTIHDLWPNLAVYIHGGVAFEPYRASIAKMMGKPMIYIETYMSSEGSFAFTATPEAKGMKLILNTGIFFEFLPFTEENFDDNGNIKGQPKTLIINEVVEGEPYAVIISTCSGAWRYLIGDVVKFVDAAACEIIIAGRTKQFLSIVGEHTSVDNLNKAMEQVIAQFGLRVSDFSVAGEPFDNLFAHHWYIGTDSPDATSEQIKEVLDITLRAINDDYAVERGHALKEVLVTLLPPETFSDYMRSQGKYGAMNKFPRVLKGEQLKGWQEFLMSR